MKAVIIYESMYGNTKTIAEAIARGFGHGSEVVVVSQARPESLDGADLVVVGGPTHMHGMSRASTRNGAAQAAAKQGSRLTLAPGAQGTGLREWFAALGKVDVAAAAFDTRLDSAALLTGRASKGITRLLREHGCTLATSPKSFLVTGDNQLRAGEEDRALDWGRLLSSKVVAMKLAADSSS
jgi:Flavodoxin